MSTQSLFTFATAAAASLAVGVTAVEGAAVTYTLVPGQSTLNLSGFYSGSPFGSQTTGSLSTTYSGTIAADRTGSEITFSGGSVVDAADKATRQAPGREGDAGDTDFANYGITFSGNFSSYVGAARDFILDLNSASLPVSGGGTFAANTIDYTADSGVLQTELNGGGNFDSESFVGNVGNNQASSNGTLTTAGGVETLTLPGQHVFPLQWIRRLRQLAPPERHARGDAQRRRAGARGAVRTRGCRPAAGSASPLSDRRSSGTGRHR